MSLALAELRAEQVTERTEALLRSFAPVVFHRATLVVDLQRLRRATQPAVAIDTDDLDVELAADRIELTQVAALRSHELGARHVAASAPTDDAGDTHHQPTRLDARHLDRDARTRSQAARRF